MTSPLFFVAPSGTAGRDQYTYKERSRWGRQSSTRNPRDGTSWLEHRQQLLYNDKVMMLDKFRVASLPVTQKSHMHNCRVRRFNFTSSKEPKIRLWTTNSICPPSGAESALFPLLHEFTLARLRTGSFWNQSGTQTPEKTAKSWKLCIATLPQINPDVYMFGNPQYYRTSNSVELVFVIFCENIIINNNILIV